MSLHRIYLMDKSSLEYATRQLQEKKDYIKLINTKYGNDESSKLLLKDMTQDAEERIQEIEDCIIINKLLMETSVGECEKKGLDFARTFQAIKRLKRP